MNLAVVNHSLHTPLIQEPANVPVDTIGDRILGVQNLTRITKPVPRPDPQDEWGVGRSPGQQMAQQVHLIHDNPDWYIGCGATIDPLSTEEFRTRTHVSPQYVKAQLERRALPVQMPGPPPQTVESTQAVPVTQLSVLPA